MNVSRPSCIGVVMLALVLAGCGGTGNSKVKLPTASTAGTRSSSLAPTSSVGSGTPLAANYFQPVDALPTTQNPVTLDPAQAQIITPSGTLTLESSAIAPALVDSTGTTNVAASGYQLWAFEAKWASGAPKADTDTQNVPDDLPTANITLSVGTTKTDTGIATENATDGEQAFVASVPTGSDAFLDVNVADVDQQLSVTTGKRAENPQASVYYLSNREYAAGASSAPSNHTSGPSCRYSNTCAWSFQFAETVKNVTLAPYDYLSNRWAPSGRAYLEVAYDDGDSIRNSGNLTFTLDESKWTATVAGQTVRQAHVISTHTPGYPSLPVKGGDGIFLVPSSTRSVRLSMPTTITATPTSDWQSDSGGAAPVPHPFTAAQLSFEATFS